MAKLKMSTRRAARRRLDSAQDIVGGGGTGSDICALLLLCFRVPIDKSLVGIVVSERWVGGFSELEYMPLLLSIIPDAGRSAVGMCQ
jgi:hypothetical protein